MLPSNPRSSSFEGLLCDSQLTSPTDIPHCIPRRPHSQSDSQSILTSRLLSNANNMNSGMDVSIEPGRRSVGYGGNLLNSTTLTGSTNVHPVQRSSSVLMRQRSQASANFLHDSLNASVDIPTCIPWQTLSTDLNDKLRQGSIKINRR